MPACSCNLPPRPKQPATAGFEPAPGRGVECFRVPPRLKKGAKKRGQARLRPCTAAKGFFLAGFEPAARAPSKVLYGYKIYLYLQSIPKPIAHQCPGTFSPNNLALNIPEHIRIRTHNTKKWYHWKHWYP